MKKRILSMLLVLVLMVALVPVSASAASVNDDSVFLTQQESVTCTLAASAMLLRRCAIMQGNGNWASITESSIASSAWINGIGLRNSFSYAGINVSKGTLPGNLTEKINFLIWTLIEHPEGIVVYNTNVPHAVVLTDYTNGVFYCADSGNADLRGRRPLSDSTFKWSLNTTDQNTIISGLSSYWSVTNYSTPVLNLGSDFYAQIVNTGTGWRPIEADSTGNARVAPKDDATDPRQIWHFIRRADSTYSIVNEYSGRHYLETAGGGVVDGTNIDVALASGGSNQFWFITQRGNGYSMRPHNCSMFLSMAANQNVANIQLASPSADGLQIGGPFIKSAEGYAKPSKPAAATVTVNDAFAGEEATITWTTSSEVNRYDSRVYNLKIWDANSKLVLEKNGLTGTSYSYTFENEASYTVQVTAVNTKYENWYTEGSKTTVQVIASHEHNYTYEMTRKPTTSQLFGFGTVTGTCSICGKKVSKTMPRLNTTDYTYTVVTPATCTATGTGRYTWNNTDYGVYSVDVTLDKTEHQYVSETIPATCSAPGGTKYTCSVCGKTYTETATVGWSDWSETKPAGVEDSLIESKTQYRSSKYETKTSYNTSESGWTRKSSDWEKANSGSVTYVKSWPGGFHTGNALYGTYNKTPVSTSETATAKTVVNSEAVSGYIYWHWCRGSYTAGPINRRVSDVCEGEFQTFHAFFSTSNASSTDANGTNGGDCKYYPNGGCCADTYWYFQIPVYTQNYTNYKKLFTYERWTDWSDWGDKEISASDTRKVETRTVYRYYTAAKEHTWDAGTVTAAATCTADGAKTYTCSVCQTTKTEPIAKLGHDYRQTVVAATCTAKGYTLNKCSRCGDEYRDAETAMLPHKYVDGVCTACGDKVTMFTIGAVTAKAGDTVTVPVEIKNNTGFAGFTLKITADANLTLTGIAKGELMEKANSGLFVDNVKGGVINWTSDRNITGDGVLLELTFTVADNAPDGKYEISVALKDDEASNCVDENGRALRAAFEAGSVLVSAAPHMHDYAVTVTAPTCTAKGYTTHTCACGDSYVDAYTDALGHAWDSGTVTKQPTATETGVRTYTCTRCSATKTETIPATGSVDVTQMFTDVTKNWAYPGIQYCVTHGIMGGMGDGTFAPTGTTTRAQIVQILYNLEGTPAVSGTTPFTDLTANWYKPAILWAYQNNVVAGTSPTTFAPDQPVTREQIAVILTQYMFHVLKMNRTWTPADLSTFPDGAQVSSWAKEAMQDAVALGLINGTKASDGVVYLDPQGSAARQQVATILMNFCQNVKK